MASIISAGTTSGTSLNLSGDTSGVLQLASNGSTTAVTITTGQNVGIGTSSPSVKLEVSGRVLGDSLVAGNAVYIWSQNRMSLGASYGIESQQNSPLFMLTQGVAQPIVFGTNSTERGRFDSSGNFLFNSGYGSVATAYGCRAWVNFDGTGTPAIRASGNVSSITDNGTGDYTVNFTTALVDANYAYVGTGRRNDGTQRPINFSQSTNAIYNSSTTALRFLTYVDAAAALEDALTFNVAIFR